MPTTPSRRRAIEDAAARLKVWQRVVLLHDWCLIDLLARLRAEQESTPHQMRIARAPSSGCILYTSTIASRIPVEKLLA